MTIRLLFPHFNLVPVRSHYSIFLQDTVDAKINFSRSYFHSLNITRWWFKQREQSLIPVVDKQQQLLKTKSRSRSRSRFRSRSKVVSRPSDLFFKRKIRNISFFPSTSSPGITKNTQSWLNRRGRRWSSVSSSCSLLPLLLPAVTLESLDAREEGNTRGTNTLFYFFFTFFHQHDFVIPEVIVDSPQKVTEQSCVCPSCKATLHSYVPLWLTVMFDSFREQFPFDNSSLKTEVRFANSWFWLCKSSPLFLYRWTVCSPSSLSFLFQWTILKGSSGVVMQGSSTELPASVCNCLLHFSWNSSEETWTTKAKYEQRFIKFFLP